MSVRINQRIFIVGCARSGTTLVQAMLSSHPLVCGFPETFYFAHARVSKHYQGKSRWLGNRRQAIYSLDSALERLQTKTQIPWYLQLRSPRSVDRFFLSALDEIAQLNNKPAWSEKTPGHVKFIERISAVCPDALFVHVLRDGRDVVASLEDLYRKTPTERQASTWNLDQSIEQWNQCREIANAYQESKRHFRLHYEHLASDPEDTMRGLCSFLGLPFEIAMLNYQSASQSVLGNDAGNEWRRDVLKPLQPTHLVKYDKLFSSAQKFEIESRLRCGGAQVGATANNAGPQLGSP